MSEFTSDPIRTHSGTILGREVPADETQPEKNPEAIEEMTVAELREKAKEEDINLHGASRKEDIIEAIEDNDKK